MKRLRTENIDLDAADMKPSENSHLSDFTTDARVLTIATIAVVVATAGLFAGIALLKLIRLATNIAYFGQFTLAELKLQDTPLGLAAVVVPVIGALIIGLMARYGSEKIRGHDRHRETDRPQRAQHPARHDRRDQPGRGAGGRGRHRLQWRNGARPHHRTVAAGAGTAARWQRFRRGQDSEFRPGQHRRRPAARGRWLTEAAIAAILFWNNGIAEAALTSRQLDSRAGATAEEQRCHR